MTIAFNMSRRGFMVASSAAAGGLALGLSLPAEAEGASAPEITAWVVVKPDDTVVVRVARSEMGQGSLTGLAQLVAEELECDWSKVTWEYPTPGQSRARKRPWGSFSTGGSQGIRQSHEYVRKGGAAARMMLIQAAANQWGAPVSECANKLGVITHVPTGRTLSYGQVAGAAAKLEPPKDIILKDAKDWTIAGKPLPRLDTADKVNGRQIYGVDLKFPGMLCAAIKDAPMFGSPIKSFDAAKAEAMPGVKKVLKVDATAVAVVAATWWQAKSALDAVSVTYDEGEAAKVSSESIAQVLKAGLDAADAFPGNRSGNVEAALKDAAKVVEATYAYPYQNHATMEPMNATALYTADKCEVWCPTQNGEAAFEAAVAASGLPAEKCEVYKIHLGGGFGRRGSSDYVRQAVLIAKQMPGAPIKLIWSREEDMTQGRYHPITQCKFRAGLDADGNLTALHMRISGQSILAYVAPQALQGGMDRVTFQGLNAGGAEGAFSYGVPNLLIDHAMRNNHVPVGFWRGVNLNQNAMYVESFIDELAHAAGQDPLAFRRKLLAKSPKNLAVLNAVAEKIGWGQPAPEGVHRGLAQIMGYASYVAAAAEISIDSAGKLKIHRIVAATNPGHAVNPQQIQAQVEGSFAYGLSASLLGECTIKDGRIEQQNFDTYPVLKIADMPKVEAIVMPSGDFWGGVGEPTIAVAAPAVMNAIFAATGQRIRQFPMRANTLRPA